MGYKIIGVGFKTYCTHEYILCSTVEINHSN